MSKKFTKCPSLYVKVSPVLARQFDYSTPHRGRNLFSDVWFESGWGQQVSLFPHSPKRVVGHKPNPFSGYARIMSTKSRSFCMTTFNAGILLAVLLLQSRDCSCYVSRTILAPPALWLHKHTDLRAHDFEHCPDLLRQSMLANVTCAWSWRLCGIAPVVAPRTKRPGSRAYHSSRPRAAVRNASTPLCTFLASSISNCFTEFGQNNGKGQVWLMGRSLVWHPCVRCVWCARCERCVQEEWEMRTWLGEFLKRTEKQLVP